MIHDDTIWLKLGSQRKGTFKRLIVQTFPNDCLEKIKKHIPDYEKSKCPCFSRKQIEQAIRNAKTKALDAEIKDDHWPHKPGITTVYRIIECITPYFKKEFQ